MREVADFPALPRADADVSAESQSPVGARFDSTKETVAKYTLDYYLPMMFKSKYVDGCYLDSLGRWCGFYNYATEHFKYSTVPLTYAGSAQAVFVEPGVACGIHLGTGPEIALLGKDFHRKRCSIRIAMLGFACDVMGSEGTPVYDAGENFYVSRVAAGIKPYCYLNASHRVSPKLWNSVLYMGYLMGANSKKGLADEKKYLPIIIKFNEAGWQPATYARARPKVVGVERWGQMNFGDEPQQRKRGHGACNRFEVTQTRRRGQPERTVSGKSGVGFKEDRLVISPFPLRPTKPLRLSW